MAITEQVQHRRGVDSVIGSAVIALAEFGYNITKKRIHVGDSVTPGGIIVPNARDVQSNEFIKCAVAGTSDHLTLTTPLGLSELGDGMEFKFIALSSNGGPVDAVIDGIDPLSPIPFRKKTESGLAALAANDIIQDGFYTAIYDGTFLQLAGTNESTGIITVSQGDLNTSLGTGSFGFFIDSDGFIDVTVFSGGPSSFSGTAGRLGVRRQNGSTVSGTGYTSLPGGEFGFYPQVSKGGSSSNRNVSYSQRYVTSSPPYDIGEGEVGGFFYALLNSSGDVVGTYLAEVPPWAYNGPTDIRCTHKCKVTGKKYRMVAKRRTLEEYMDGASVQAEAQEITNDIKNADMDIIPHPFLHNEPDLIPVLLDPMDDRIKRLVEYQQLGGWSEIQDAISRGLISVDNEKVHRNKCASLKGCDIHTLKFKYTGRL